MKKAINHDDTKTTHYRIINKGDVYGLHGALIHNEEEPLIEFYSYSYFISRYYLKTFMMLEEGLCLDGTQRQFDLPYVLVKEVQENVKNEFL